MSTDLKVIDTATGELSDSIYSSDPQELVAAATARANALRTVITSQKLSVRISGREYVVAEGWTTLAAMHGVVPLTIASERHEDGSWHAIVELQHIGTGRVFGRAHGQCGGPTDGAWAERPEYARESMAITRATAKACRLSFSWVMTLAGFAATPAEEMQSEPIASPQDVHDPHRELARPPRDVEMREVPAATGVVGGPLTDKQLAMLQRMLGRRGKAEKWLEMKLKIDALTSLPMERVDEALGIIRDLDEAGA